MAASKNKELEELKNENARLQAALAESKYYCQRLEIINSDLALQLEESNRELENNISVLQGLKSEIEGIVSSIKSSNKK